MTSWSTKYAVVSWVGNHMRNKDLTAASGASMEQLTEPLTRGMMEAAHANLKAANWTPPSDIQTLPAFVVRNHIHYGDVEPSPANDLFPAWYKQKSGGANAGTQTLDKVSGKLATSCTPELAKETQGGSNDNIFSADIFVGVHGSSTSSALGNDDAHNCSDVKPQITLTSPSSCSATCTFTVTVTQGTFPFASDKFPGTVEFYVGGQKVQSQPVTGSPSTVSFTYTPTATGPTDVQAKVIDSGLYDASMTATVQMSTGSP